jgi:hypothetical protein
MQKPLNIDYRFTAWPLFIVFFCVILFLFALSVLSVDAYLRVIFIIAICSLGIWQYISFNHKANILRYSDNAWLVFDENNKYAVALQGGSFISTFLLVLIFKVNNSNKQYSFFFTKKNCGEECFRELCRLAIIHRSKLKDSL